MCFGAKMDFKGTKLVRFTLNLAFGAMIAIYPFMLFFGESGAIVIFLVAIFALCVAKYALFKNALLLISGVFLALAIFARILGFSNFAFFYPSAVNLALFGLFASSLKSEAIITKFAKLQNPHLDSRGVIYTRNLTKIWCAIFIFNGAVAAILAILENKIYWSVFSGIVAYIIVGGLLGGEVLYRKLILKI